VVTKTTPSLDDGRLLENKKCLKLRTPANFRQKPVETLSCDKLTVRFTASSIDICGSMYQTPKAQTKNVNHPKQANKHRSKFLLERAAAEALAGNHKK
jgi:hypothetical protein